MEKLRREKLLLTSFFFGNVTDIVVTALGTQLPGINEVGIAGREYFINQKQMEMYILKLGITAAIAGLYALGHTHQKIGNINMLYVLDKTIKIGNILVWSAVFWNILNITPALLK